MSDVRDLVLKTIMNNISESSEGVILTIRVDLDLDVYLTIEGGDLVLKSPSAGDPGRCNATLIGYLSRMLKIPSSKIEVVYGVRGTVKRVLLRDVSIDDLIQKLQRLIRLV